MASCRRLVFVLCAFLLAAPRAEAWPWRRWSPPARDPDGAGFATLIRPAANPAPATGLKAREFGDMTYYYGRSNLGACGTPVEDTAFHCALPGWDFDPHTPGTNPNNNSLCYRNVCLKSPKTGQTSVCLVKDRCPSNECQSGDIDVTMPVFESLGYHLDEGRVPITWWFCDEPPPAKATGPQLAVWIITGIASLAVLVGLAAVFFFARRRAKIAVRPPPLPIEVPSIMEKPLVVSPTKERPSLYNIEDVEWSSKTEFLSTGVVNRSPVHPDADK
ncbi:hypothetical protein DFJ74DRAFT_196921 [Hyaloraphidium curvatum]|nr:hypothetical protein DFJ74DRAFT_196921 [Hyaloraphidium curvatum]